MSEGPVVGEALHALGFVFAVGAALIIVALFLKDQARVLFYVAEETSEKKRGHAPPDINHMKRL